MEEAIPPNFYAPIHASLVRPVLLYGVPHKAFISVWTTALALSFGGGEWWALPIAMVLHPFMAWLTKLDPDFMHVFRDALYTPKQLEP